MPKFLDFNPTTGVWHEDEYSHADDEYIVHIKQDVEPVLEYAKTQRNSGINDKVGDFGHYAIIPAVTQMELIHKHGINIHDKYDEHRLLKIIETEYPHLKTTNLRHSVSKGD